MYDNSVLMHGNEIQVETVRAIDPLGADSVMASLPEMNALGDVSALVRSVRELLPSLDWLIEVDIDTCLATMRDIGMLLGSVKRHGPEPVPLIPGLTPVLTLLGRRTAMIPRDVVHHYCTWNPDGERRRMYCGDDQERELQNSVRLVFPHLRAALELCHLLRGLEPEDPKFAVLVDALDRELSPLVSAIDEVTEKVSPRFFARTLRPYFEEFTVDGRVYLGPAAAQVPLWLVDEAVWASDLGDAAYLDFLEHSVPYSLPRWRELHSDWAGTPSLITRLLEAYGDDPEAADRAAPGLRASARSMVAMLRTIVVFRGRHLGIARKAYHEDMRLYPLGSGGASVELLREIITLTRETAQMTRAASDSHTAGAGT